MEGVLRVPQGAKQTLRITAKFKRLRAQPTASALSGSLPGKGSTLYAFQPDCVRASMKADMGEFVRQCLHYVHGEAAEQKPPLLGELIHGERVGDVINMAFRHIGVPRVSVCKTF